MSSPAPRNPFTAREYRLLPEDGKRWELIEGDFFVSASSTPLHQRVSRRLQYALMTQLEHTGLAEVFNAPMDVQFDDYNVVEPDLVIVSNERASSITARCIEGVPDVLVEILSPSTMDRDRQLKKRLYERFGVREYWVVDPQHACVETFRLGSSGYELRERYDRAATLRCPDFPRLEIPLAPVFA